jgi:hypothetical protein
MAVDNATSAGTNRLKCNRVASWFQQKGGPQHNHEISWSCLALIMTPALVLIDVTTQLQRSARSETRTEHSCCYCSFSFSPPTNSMSQTPFWEPNSSSVAKFTYYGHRNFTAVCTTARNQTYVFHIRPPCFFKINFVFFQFELKSSDCSLYFGFSKQSCEHLLSVLYVLHKRPLSVSLIWSPS